VSLSSLVSLVGALRKVVKGDIKIDTERGLFTLSGERLIVIPSSSLIYLWRELYALIGEGTNVVFEGLGRSAALSVKKVLGLDEGDPRIILRRIADACRVAGFGQMSFTVDGDSYMVMIKYPPLPKSNDPQFYEAVARLIGGSIQGFLGNLEIQEIRCNEDECIMRIKAS